MSEAEADPPPRRSVCRLAWAGVLATAVGLGFLSLRQPGPAPSRKPEVPLPALLPAPSEKIQSDLMNAIRTRSLWNSDLETAVPVGTDFRAMGQLIRVLDRDHTEAGERYYMCGVGKGQRLVVVVAGDPERVVRRWVERFIDSTL